MNVSFKRTQEEDVLIERAVLRARTLGDQRASIEISMDLSATNANGCPLDFDKLLAFDDFSFLHDIYGIARHLDRESGQLNDCFLPRCAR